MNFLVYTQYFFKSLSHANLIACLIERSTLFDCTLKYSDIRGYNSFVSCIL